MVRTTRGVLATTLAAALCLPAAARSQEGDGRVGVATYYECDMALEDQADEILETEFAPVFDRYLEAGELRSWAWLAHDLGGKWRRAAAFYAADHQTLFRVRNAILEELRTEKAEATRAFTEICHTHEDYVWIVLLSRPGGG